ncbi:antibiotic biosynthesis monooxygenase [Nonomuraea sp. NBC_00507]|uniref:antibiotic biosynthesis monooxygenase family protein n=1 Tax=Nonomuraea sp. NBC_00507 TaxID=2976002 RepID=UPI002E188599
MATITTDEKHYTLINIFRVTPENQRRMYDIILDATDVITKFPGYVSANVHLSDDGTRVVNYAQWRTKEDFDAMRAHPSVQEHFAACRALADIEPIFCHVEYTHEV